MGKQWTRTINTEERKKMLTRTALVKLQRWGWRLCSRFKNTHGQCPVVVDPAVFRQHSTKHPHDEKGRIVGEHAPVAAKRVAVFGVASSYFHAKSKDNPEGSGDGSNI